MCFLRVGDSNKERLLECTAETLKKYYNEDACCINNLANCNYIEKAWRMRVNVLKHEQLCKYENQKEEEAIGI